MSEQQQGRILVLSGPAGVGKSSVCARLLASEGYVLSVSATTRAPRGVEQDGVDYHFMTVEEFQRRIDAGEFLEYATVHNKQTYYGTPAGPLLEHLVAGRHVLLDIDVQGAAQLREKVPVVCIFLRPPSFEALRERLEGRQDTSGEEIERRLETAERELAEAWRYDHQVVNDDLDRVVNEIRELLAQR